MTTTRKRSPAATAKTKATSAAATRKPVAAKKTAPTTPPVKASAATPKKREKMIRDSFTIPKTEFGALTQVKQRAAELGHPVKKSEVLRAGIKALVAMANAPLLAALRAVPSIKTGRPAALESAPEARVRAAPARKRKAAAPK